MTHALHNTGPEASATRAASDTGTPRRPVRRRAKGKVATGGRARRGRTADEADAPESGRSHRGVRKSSALKYAQDNAVVQAVSAFTTGPTRPLFILLVVAAVGVGLYFPVRDLYIAYRSQMLLEEQIAIREAYNALLEEEVEQLLSEEGIQIVARKELGMVMEGETALIVTGLDEDGNPIVESDTEDEETDEDAADDESDDSVDEDSTPTTSTEVAAAEAAVYLNSAWYWELLDSVFFFDGTGAQVVVSTGE